MADHRHDITMTTGPGAQNAEAVLGIMVGYALDKARQHFLGSWFGTGAHRLIASCKS